jgi:ubiquinone/menaquinone biosynthesis C-methylase UbiE
MMKQSDNNRFQDFFKEDKYITLKNYLYNYLLRKIAVQKNLHLERPDLVFEMGSGISPIMTGTNRIIFSDLSLNALQILKRTHGKGRYVVADGMCLPFKNGAFSHTICSEVLEHLEDDLEALKEVARIMRPSGRLIVTFPHRKFYFANDDRFVNHFRRYELPEIQERLRGAGFKPNHTQKVMGPLEKVTMCFVVFCFSSIQKFKPAKTKEIRSLKAMNVFAFFFKWINRMYMGPVWLDAKIVPRPFSTVLLINATLSG